MYPAQCVVDVLVTTWKIAYIVRVQTVVTWRSNYAVCVPSYRSLIGIGSGLSQSSAIAVGLAVFVLLLVLGAFYYMHQRQREQYVPLSVNDTNESYIVGGFEGTTPNY